MVDGDASPAASAVTAPPTPSPPDTPPDTPPPPPLSSPPPLTPPPPPAPIAPPRRRSLYAGRGVFKSDTDATASVAAAAAVASSPDGRARTAATAAAVAAGRDPDTAPPTPPSPQLVRSAGAAARTASGAEVAAPDTASVGLQVLGPGPWRLRVLPVRRLGDGGGSGGGGCGGCGRLAGRVLLSQAGLAVVLLAWALLGAWAFRQTEGPHERRRVASVRAQQAALAEELAEAARQLAAVGGGACAGSGSGSGTVPAALNEGSGATADGSGEGSGGGSGGGSGDGASGAAETWRAAAESYVRRHEALLLAAVDDGFGEGGGGPIWTFPGCVLFAVSLLTTLGFGAPVPRTTGGRVAAAVFAAVGIPLHLLLALNAGALAAARLTCLAKRMERRRLRRKARAAQAASANNAAPATPAHSPPPPPPPPPASDGWSPRGGSCPCTAWQGGTRWPWTAAAACGDACAGCAAACGAVAWPCAHRRRGECAPAPGPQPLRQTLHAPAVAPTDAGDKAAVAAYACDVSSLEAGVRKAAASTPAPPAAEDEPPPRWLQWTPAAAAALYYVAGVIAFGCARARPAAACLLFPLDFTATGGVGRVTGSLRALYAVYLEGAVLLAATGVALHRVAAARGLTALGLRWGLLTNDDGD